MSIEVVCGSCGKRHKADEKYAGKRGKCKQCGAPMEVPALAAVPDAADDFGVLGFREEATVDAAVAAPPVPPPPPPLPTAIPIAAPVQGYRPQPPAPPTPPLYVPPGGFRPAPPAPRRNSLTAWRIVLVLIAVGVGLALEGIREIHLNAIALSTPQVISCNDLCKNGYGHNANVHVTDLKITPYFVWLKNSETSTNYDVIWVPVIPKDKPQSFGQGSNIRLIVKSKDAKTDADVTNLAAGGWVEGLIVSDIESITGKDRTLLEDRYTGIDLNNVMILEQNRQPSAVKAMGFTAGGMGLMVIGLAALAWGFSKNQNRSAADMIFLAIGSLVTLGMVGYLIVTLLTAKPNGKVPAPVRYTPSPVQPSPQVLPPRTSPPPHGAPQVSLADFRRQVGGPHLLKHGPSPQPPQELPATPDGAQTITYSSDGLSLKAWTARPPGNNTVPGVVFLHGGFSLGSDDWPSAQKFLDAGFAVMEPALRGEDGNPGEFEGFYGEVDDAIAAADTLAKTPGVDGKRIYICGHSAGGTLTMLAVELSDRFAAAVSMAGNPLTHSIRYNNQDVTPFAAHNADDARARQPMQFAASVKCPLTLVVGDKDMALAAGNQAMEAISKQAGKKVQLLKVPGDHFTSLDPAIDKAIEIFKGGTPQ